MFMMSRFWWYNLAMAMNIKGKNPTPVESEEEEETLPHLLVTTIKLGTKSCGFAYQLKAEFKENPANVHSFIFKTGTTIRIDFPPALTLTREGRAEEFGYEAIKQFEEMEGYSEDYVFFENVIESLYISEDFSDANLIKDSKGSAHRALDVFGKFIRILFDYFNEVIVNQIPNVIKPLEIKWVLMIPSVRAGSGVVPFFEKAWNEVFRNEDMRNLTTVTFPSAALAYYLYLPPEKCEGICIDNIQTGERVMMIGFEDELDSFNIYEKLEDRKFKQVVNFLSGASSKCLIIKAFDSFFDDLIGSWLWKVAKQINVDLWPDMVSKIDDIIESNRDTESMVTFRHVAFDLQTICEKHTNMSLEQIVAKSVFATKITCRQPNLRVKLSLINTLFDKCLSKVVNDIEHVLTKSDKEVTTLILAGNMASSNLLKHALQTTFPSKHIVVLKEAALKGAVLFGQEHIVVSSIFSGAQVMVTV
ncbi:unnamed protein product [Mytilus edulis]|uniref:Uncharacterized protein n=1 Tax=Mytilus edulis TaxID=6550 RepID=A0A8S3Q568_MYTED|nr:unnamed protein product [Mytilus edulis]